MNSGPVILTIVWLTFLLSPLLALIITLLTVKKDYPDKKRLYYFFLVSFIVIIAFYLTDMSFRGVLIDTVMFGIAYLLYCLLIYFLVILRRKFYNYILFVAGLIPIALFTYVSGTGPFLFMSVIGDSVPTYDRQINEIYSYRVYPFGREFFICASGEEIQINYNPSLFPGLEKELYSKTFEYVDYELEDTRVELVESDKKEKFLVYSSGELIFTFPDDLK